jgi:hypothetical protein
MRPNNAAPNASDPRPDWEAPAFTKMPITSRTGSGANAATDPSGTVEPAAPGQPISKLGFSFEWAFPMSSRN